MITMDRIEVLMGELRQRSDPAAWEYLNELSKAARRGVEADDRLTHLEEAYQSAMRVGSEAQQRAEKAEARATALDEMFQLQCKKTDEATHRAMTVEAALAEVGPVMTPSMLQKNDRRYRARMQDEYMRLCVDGQSKGMTAPMDRGAFEAAYNAHSDSLICQVLPAQPALAIAKERA